MMKEFSTGSFIAGVMVGLLLAGGWVFSQNDLLNTPFPPTVRTATSTPESNAISVADQPAGDSVTIQAMTVPSPGIWIAVREMHGSDFGNVLGAARVGSMQTATTIPLLRATVPGHTYAIEFYRDDNDGIFDAQANSVYVDFATGLPVIAYFATTE